MLHLLPEEHKTNCGTDLTDREGFREGRESPGREKTQPDQRENQTPTHNGSDELERGTGGQGWFWRLTGRDLVGREEGEWGRKIIGRVPSLFHST